MNPWLVGVAVEKTAYHFDKEYTYLVPEGVPVPKVGCRVLVPFGGKNSYRTGFVLSCKNEPADSSLKPILRVLDDSPLLSEEMVKLAFFMKEHTFCTLFDACKTMLPAGIGMQLVTYYQGGSLERLASLANTLPPHLRTLCEELGRTKASISEETLLAKYSLSPDGKELANLVKQGLLIAEKNAVRRMGDATLQMVQLTPLGENEEVAKTFTKKQKAVWELLSQVTRASVKEVCYYTGVTAAVVNTMAKKGFVSVTEEEAYRVPHEKVLKNKTGEITLSPSQKDAYDTLCGLLTKPAPACALLYGVTGSGKTSVYLKLIDYALQQDPNAGILVMVPEISLTPQAVAIFKGRYGSKVAVFHSRLSMGQRLDEFKRVKKGLATIVVGTRSAVFAPVNRLQLMVIDEEQEHTYKSESSPRFHARDIARFRAGYHNALLVLASATPSVESFAKAKKGVYTLCTMKERYGNGVLPGVSLVDMKEEMAKGNTTVFSAPLVERLEQVLEQKKQAILLLNRRGYHTYISCSDCGKVLECENCSISMTYHRENNRVLCHYCGASMPLPEKCPACGGNIMKMTGVGTQKAQEQLEQLLPTARILRMDADTTLSRYSHEEKLQAFGAGEYDILIGTQMVAKGLDFPNVSLVGVLTADGMLHSNDYRAYERGFSLLTQVIGRAGRADGAGVAVIQTAEPDHELIELSKNQDYNSFYEQEILIRQMMQYPPFCDICMVGFVGLSEEKTRMAAHRMLDLMKQLVSKEFSMVPLKILGPSPAQVVRVVGKYRYRMIIKCKNNKDFRTMMATALQAFGKEKGLGGVTAFADMNPEGIL